MEVNRKFWEEFFDMYKELPCLWKTKCPEYSNRLLKKQGYLILAEKLKELYPEADKQFVLKKINIFRTSYRREAKKVSDSYRSGAREPNLYKPNLWYYDLISFLGDQGDESINGEEYPREQTSGEEEFLDEESVCLQPPGPRSAKKRKREIQKQQTRDQEFLIKQEHQAKLIQQQKERINALQRKKQIRLEKLQQQQQPPLQQHQQITEYNHTTNNDEAMTISSTWGILYRDLEPRQKLYANKAITEVLYQGALGKLHELSYKSVENQQQLNAKKFENPLEITIDRVGYNDVDLPLRHISNINEALNYLKPLEEYAVRENHAAMNLVSQLEETLRNLAEDPDYYSYND